MSTRTTRHFVARQRSRTMVPVILAEASFRRIAKSLSDSLNQLKSHEVLHAPYPSTGSQLSGFAIPCSQPFPLFRPFKALQDTSATTVPQSHRPFSAKPSDTSSFAFWEMTMTQIGWKRPQLLTKAQSELPQTCCLVLVMGFTWYPLLACLRQIKWEARQCIRVRHTFWDWV